VPALILTFIILGSFFKTDGIGFIKAVKGNFVMRRWSSIVLFALLIIFPIFVNSIDPFLVVFGTNILIYVILGLGLQAIFGAAGMVELCHAAFFGIGAYTSALLAVKFGLPFILTAVCGIVAAVLGGLIMAPIVRLRESYYAMSTFAFGGIVTVLLRELPFTGGVNGLGGIPPVAFGAISFEDPIWFYYLVLGVVVGIYLLFQKLASNFFGMSLNAVRQNEASSQAIGINPNWMRSLVTLLGAGSAGLAGVLIAHSQGFISPDMFNTDKSLFVVGIVVVGGLRYAQGAWLGAIAMMFISEYTRELREYITLVYGLILALSMIFFPQGLWGLRTLVTRKETRKYL
jgi:branched-chain amino acid transport system permease protein